MLYNLPEEQVRKIKNTNFLPEFKKAEMLTATFETDPDIVKSILPGPLVPAGDNTALAYVAKFQETNFGCVYNEGALFLNCMYKGERGGYCLSMPVDDDMALIGGRETYGYPKKIADSITLEHDGDYVIGRVARKGTEIIRIECQLSENAPEDYFSKQGSLVKDWDGVACIKVISFLFKYFQSPGGNSFDYLPRLIREPVLFRSKKTPRTGAGTLQLGATIYDPLSEITVNKVTGITHGIFDNTMLPGRVVARVWNPLRFLKHAFFKNDFVATLLAQYDPAISKREKEIMKLARKY